MKMEWLFGPARYTSKTVCPILRSNLMPLTVKVVVDASQPDEARQIESALREVGVNFDIMFEPSDCRQAPACRWLNASCVTQEGRLAGALLDAIHTIEDTRHSFKSKQLGALRKRLQHALEACQAHNAPLTCNC